MIKRKERRQEFHDSLLNMLYAPPSPPLHQNEFDDQTLSLAREIANSDHHRINTGEFEGEEERSFTTSGEEEGELGSQKLTRAQRKRLRKKKLKEAASHRRQIIGPQLPTTSDNRNNGEVGDVPEHQQWESVRQNVTERPESGNDHNLSGEIPSSIKVKQRRMSKKNARDKPKTPSTDRSHEAPSPGDQNEAFT